MKHKIPIAIAAAVLAVAAYKYGSGDIGHDKFAQWAIDECNDFNRQHPEGPNPNAKFDPIIDYPYEKSEKGNVYFTGKLTGIVLDSQTCAPIDDAKMFIHYKYGYYSYRYAVTDKKGKYKISTKWTAGCPISAIYMYVYKKGYECYMGGSLTNKDVTSDGSCFSTWIKGPRQLFRRQYNVILLRKWDDKKLTDNDRIKHLDFMGCDWSYSPLDGGSYKKKYCAEAREEIIYDCMIRGEKDYQMCEEEKNKWDEYENCIERYMATSEKCNQLYEEYHKMLKLHEYSHNRIIRKEHTQDTK